MLTPIEYLNAVSATGAPVWVLFIVLKNVRLGGAGVVAFLLV